jgi:hypothetical protein
LRSGGLRRGKDRPGAAGTTGSGSRPAPLPHWNGLVTFQAKNTLIQRRKGKA